MGQQIDCEYHSGRKSDTRLNLYGANGGESWSANVCFECEERIMEWARQINPDLIDAREIKA